MATTKGPLFSLDASGTVGGAIVFSHWKGRNVVRRHAVPANPKSGGQVGVRSMMKFLSQQWASLTAAEQATWDTPADGPNISPFNAYVANGMSRWGVFDPPGQDFPIAAAGTAGTLLNQTAVAQSRAILLGIDVSVLADNWGILIHRDPITAFTPSRQNVVQVIAGLSAATFTFLDFPLVVGVEQFYRWTPFTDDGVLGAFATEASATPTA